MKNPKFLLQILISRKIFLISRVSRVRNLDLKDLTPLISKTCTSSGAQSKRRNFNLSRIVRCSWKGCQLEDSHCHIRSYFKAQKLSLLFQFCGMEVYEEYIHLFYANLWISKDSGELETLVLENSIIVNKYLFEQVFGTKFFGVIPFMVVDLKILRSLLKQPKVLLLNLTLTFQSLVLTLFVLNITSYPILLLPLWFLVKNLSTISPIEMCLCSTAFLRNIASIGLPGFYEYIVENAENTNANASLPYGLIISRILVSSMIDLFDHKPIEISSTYDSRSFNSMGML